MNSKNRLKNLTPGMALWHLLKGFIYLTMIFFAFTFVGSLIWILINSFKSATDYMQNAFGLPQLFDWENYKQVFTNLRYKGYGILGMMGNSMIQIGWGWLVTLTLPHMVAYVMARFDFKGKNILDKAIWISMIVPIIGTGSSTFWFLDASGLYDTWAGIFLLSAAGVGFSSIMIQGVYAGVDKSYAEAAYLDGANEMMVFLKIYYPQAMPLTLLFIVTSFITTWGDFMTPYLYLPSHPTFALGLQQMQAQFVDFGNDYPVMFAAVVISLIPILTLYLRFNKQITENTAIGSLK